jgi:hypothetical protein
LPNFVCKKIAKIPLILLDERKNLLYNKLTISPRGAFSRKTQAEIIPFEPDKIMLDWEEDEIIGSLLLCVLRGSFLFFIITYKNHPISRFLYICAHFN